MELNFPTVSLSVLRLVVWARKVLITHQCSGYWLAVVTWHQGCLQHSPLHQQTGGWRKSWEGTSPGPLTQTDQRDISHRMKPAQQEELRERRGALIILIFVFWSYRCASWSPEYWEEAEHHLHMGIRAKIFCFPLLLSVAFAFGLFNYLFLDPQVF